MLKKGREGFMEELNNIKSQEDRRYRQLSQLEGRDREGGNVIIGDEM